jgi:hypothetical protein
VSTLRPLRWHHLLLTKRLARKVVCLDAQTRLTVGEINLGRALLASLPIEVSSSPTYVLRNEHGVAIGQMRHRSGNLHAHITYLAPAPSPDDFALWLALLDGLVYAAGTRGAADVVAEVDDDSPALEVLRAAGFALYLRQDIWCREVSPLDQPDAAERLSAGRGDAFEIVALYGNIVPGLIQQVEPPPSAADTCYVLAGGQPGERGFVAAWRGPRGVLIDVYMHPSAAERASEAIGGALAHLPAHRVPIYCRRRPYQIGLEGALEAHGFKWAVRQALMVRHAAARIEKRVFKPLPSFDGGARLGTPTVRHRLRLVPGEGESLQPDAHHSVKLGQVWNGTKDNGRSLRSIANPAA